jgi:hypothetical protein
MLTDYQKMRVARRLVHHLVTAQKWETLPKGWTEKSFQKFWKTISEKSKHPVTLCIEKMKDKMKDPGAFCAAAKDRATGDTSWRSERKASKSEATAFLQDKLESWGLFDISMHTSGGNWVTVEYQHTFPSVTKAHQVISRGLWNLGVKTHTADFGPGDTMSVDTTPFLRMERHAKLDPVRSSKLVMRNFRRMVNAAVAKGGNGGLEDLGAIGNALNWIKSIKSPAKVEDYLLRASNALKPIRGGAAFLRSMQELVTASQKVPLKHYPTMGQTAILNALYDFSDAVVTMVMAKNRAQQALLEPEHYNSNLKAEYASAQKRLESFIARNLTPPEEKTQKATKTKTVKPTKEDVKEAPPADSADKGPEDKADEDKDKPHKTRKPAKTENEGETENEEETTDSFGLSGRYKDRSLDETKSKKRAMALHVLQKWNGLCH